jgi:hypothetical protein
MLREMVRALPASFVVMLVLGCADVGGGEDTNPFGDGTAATSTATGNATQAASDGEASTAGSGDATGTPTTDATTTDPPTTADASSSGPPPGTDDATTAPSDTSGGPTGPGELGECIGIGAWESCAQYCEAVLEACVEAGCDGATVLYYPDVGACTAMRDASSAATPCDQDFAMGGGASFARCCCQ